MTAADLRTLRQRMRLTQLELASALRVTPTTVARWEQGKYTIGPLARLALLHLAHLYGAVAGTPKTKRPRRPRRPPEAFKPYAPGAAAWRKTSA